jgi:hypothetical protein
MTAAIEEQSYVLVVIPYKDKLVVTDVSNRIISRIRNFRLVPDEYPGFIEYILQFLLIYTLIVIDGERDRSLLESFTKSIEDAL